MTDEIFVFDDFISESYQEHIKHIMLNDSSWYFSQDITFSVMPKDTDRRPRPSFGHSLIKDSVPQTATQSFLHPMILEACAQINFEVKDILLGRAIIQLPLADDIVKEKEDFLHIDRYADHLVCLYYVVDADGDTLIYDKKRQPNEVQPSDYPDEYLAKDYKLLKRVTPKQGRVVLFNGNYYHTAEQPRLGIRCILNYNVV